MLVGSVCSGILTDALAWEPLGWQHAWCAEIDRFASRVIAVRWPHIPNLGDFTQIGEEHGPVDLLVGGTPCQSFSLAGRRAGLDDPRGNLAIEFLRLAHRVSARWLVWENVPGVLSSRRGRDFGAFLGALAELGYGWAYRVLDAQYFGLAQRRKRVFLVAHSGGAWQRAAAVLFELSCLRGDPAPSRETSEKVAGPLSAGASRVGAEEATAGHTIVDKIAHCLTQRPDRLDPSTETLILDRKPAVTAFHQIQDPIIGEEFSPALGAKSCGMGVYDRYHVRRLTPRECERLQGYPDDYTAIEGASDTARYRAIGNGIAVPVLHWIGKRIDAVEKLSCST